MTDLVRSQGLSASPRWTGDKETFDRLGVLGDRYRAALDTAREVSLEIEHEMESTGAAGCSLMELSVASGLSVSQIEYILVAVDVQRCISAL
jgi:hypothetical protein